MRILIVEDEIYLADTLHAILKKENYVVDVVHDGLAGYENALDDIYDLILLDIMLPKMDGLTVLKKLRESQITTPIILLTAKSEVSDKVLGLDNGADDYLPKPFETEELLARIRANLRRRNDIICDDNLSFGDLTLDKQNLLLIKDATKVNLTLKEAELMEFFMLRKKSVSSKDLIIEKIWGYDSDADYNHVEVYVSFLRKKIAYLRSTVSIHTVRGIGYTLKEQDNV